MTFFTDDEKHRIIDALENCYPGVSARRAELLPCFDTAEAFDSCPAAEDAVARHLGLVIGRKAA